METSTRMQLHRFLALALALVLVLFPLSTTGNCLPCQRPNLPPRGLFNVFVAPLQNDLVAAGQSFNFRWINLDGGRINLVLVKGTPDDLETGKRESMHSSRMGVLAEAVPNKGSYMTVVPMSIPAGNDYAIELQWGAERSYTPLFTILNTSES
ncbi:hypothetical protein K525DRAFT_200705 [Schizophyllum commune Loenen D]|nr:hypothetical protein K525DRAFT_200705 [Schizophyllum commune Loenen D]